MTQTPTLETRLRGDLSLIFEVEAVKNFNGGSFFLKFFCSIKAFRVTAIDAV